MNSLLKLSAGIDWLSGQIGKLLMWFVLAATLISAVNAIVRKTFNYSSNAYLEVQWYLFAAIVLIGAGYTLMRQEHVKIDVVLGRFSRRTQIKVEIFGILLFLMPFVVSVIYEVMPLVMRALQSGEMSESAGGLIRWPVYALVPIGFALLGLQGVSELIKRVAFLQNLVPDPGKKIQEKSAEEELAEEILRAQEKAQKAAAGVKP